MQLARSSAAPWRGLLALLLLLALVAARAGELVTVKAGSIVGPLSNPIVWNIVKSKGLDRKHGLQLELELYPSIAAFYGGFSRGETEIVMGGPTIFHKLLEDEVLLKIIATAQKLSDLAIFSSDPDQGPARAARPPGGGGPRLLAVQMMEIVARTIGIDLGKEAQLVQASFAVSKALLLADRVDAALIAEPLATLTALENPKLSIIFNGHDGWETVVAVREELLARHPGIVNQLIAALQDAARFLKTHPDEADRVLSPIIKLPPGVLSQAIRSGRLDYDFQPAWTAQRAVIWDLYERAVAAGFYVKLPPASIIYVP